MKKQVYKLLFAVILSIISAITYYQNPFLNQISGTDNRDACDLNPNRKANVKSKIGYGQREYIATTNQYKQLVHVKAEQLSLQNESNLMNNRYCGSIAKVEGTQDQNFDRGHVIADSLGGVSNAYNITPEASKLNRTGQKAKIENLIRKALNNSQKVTQFEAIITYPDTASNIPNKYTYRFLIDGEQYEYTFENNNDERS